MYEKVNESKIDLYNVPGLEKFNKYLMNHLTILIGVRILDRGGGSLENFF
jgi:hypothetical protein